MSYQKQLDVTTIKNLAFECIRKITKRATGPIPVNSDRVARAARSTDWDFLGLEVVA